MSLQIIKSGFCTLLQDYGRFGMQKYGFSQGGPMDEHAFLWANKLLNNDFNDAQIEMCQGGFTAKFLAPTQIAICGAKANMKLNAQEIEPWRTYAVEHGDEIHIAGFKSGVYAYLAVKGGFQVPPSLGSCATVMRENIGGVGLDQHQQGKPLENNLIVNFPFSDQFPIMPAATPHEYIPYTDHEVTLRIIPDQTADVSQSLVDSFLQQEFTLSKDINRMGYRLQSDPTFDSHFDNTASKVRISRGTSLGTIQLPPDGQPIVLMKDRQTIGGYPAIACVAFLDIPKLSQSRPSTKVRFQLADLQELESEVREYLLFFDVGIT